MGGRIGREPETLHELLDDEAIQLGEAPRFNGKNMGGPRTKLLCPACGGGKQREKNFFVLFDPDGLGFRYMCHRANNCGITGGRRLKGAPMLNGAAWTPKVYRRPEPPAETPRPDKMLAYFAGFGISAQTVSHFGVYRTSHKMPVLENGKQTDERRETTVLAYPYREDGALLNVKYKAIYPGGAKRFLQEFEAEPSLFHIDAFTDDALGIFVEGEDDCMAVYEAGYRQVTTLADGSPSKIGADYSIETDDDDRYLPIRGNCNAKIAKLKRVILAGDMDVAGRNHHEEIARRLGKERCWMVRWPDGCKDAKDTLMNRGRDAVRLAIANAEPYPIAGIASYSVEELNQLYLGARNRRYTTGYMHVDERINLSDTGQVIVTTGIPSHGKSAFALAFAELCAERWEEEAKLNPMLSPFHTVVFSAELDGPRVMADLVSQRAHKPFFPNVHIDRLAITEIPELVRWVKRFFSFIDPDSDDNRPMPRLSWLKAMTRIAVKRTGAKLAIWDPWQEIDDEMPATWRKNHSEWIKECLVGIRKFARELGVNIMIVAHPKKVDLDKSGHLRIPHGYDINNSQAFYSACHIGLTVHRPDLKRSDMLIRNWKARESRMVKMGDSMLRFDPSTTRVWPLPVELDALGEPMQQHWQDEKG